MIADTIILLSFLGPTGIPSQSQQKNDLASQPINHGLPNLIE